jgi:hypothetical protein
MKILTCALPTLNPDNTVVCDSWEMVELESLATQTDFYELRELLEFDPVLFSTLLTGFILTFVSGHVTGVIVRRMNR